MMGHVVKIIEQLLFIIRTVMDATYFLLMYTGCTFIKKGARYLRNSPFCQGARLFQGAR